MNVLGVDVGEIRIGLAIANDVARIPSPYSVLLNGDGVVEKIDEIAKNEEVSKIIIGLPRNMKGEETEQSAQIREWAKKLEEDLNLPITFCDESLSSVRAEKLQKYDPKRQSGQPIDDLAACFILEEFFSGVKNE